LQGGFIDELKAGERKNARDGLRAIDATEACKTFIAVLTLAADIISLLNIF
jgi:hypothetical protein